MFKQQETMGEIAHEFLIKKKYFIMFFCQEDERMQ